MSCIFCKLGAKGTLARLPNNLFWIRLDIHPVSPGHMLVIPKRHVTTTEDLTSEEGSQIWQISRQIMKFMSGDHAGHINMHYQSILDSNPSGNSAWFIRRALKHPRFGSKPDGCNYGLNEGEAAGQTVEHLHWHVIPRYKGDMADPSGGIRYAIPDSGNYHQPRA